MQVRRTVTLIAAGALVLTSVGAAAASTRTVVLPDDTSWEEVNVRGEGTSVISDDVPDRLGGTGSLRQSTSGSLDKTDFQTFRDFGPVGEVETLSFDWYRDSSSTAPQHLTPAVGIHVADDAGNSWLLKWEGAYNGYPTNGPAAPVDLWVTEDLASANYWRIPQWVAGEWVGFAGCNAAGDPFGCFVFTRSLTDGWLDGYDIVGLEIGIGSGWNGTFLSYADLLTVNGTTFDFEPREAPVDVVLEGPNDCKDGGWSASTAPEFRNQGQCVSYFVANERAGR